MSVMVVTMRSGIGRFCMIGRNKVGGLYAKVVVVIGRSVGRCGNSLVAFVVNCTEKMVKEIDVLIRYLSGK